MNKPFLLLFIFIFLLSCGNDDCPTTMTTGDLSSITYNPVPYIIVKPTEFPEMLIPADNPLTEEGIELGRHLFYDPILSADSTMSCSSCHLPSLSFSDGNKFSAGIEGVVGTRSSMSLINIGYVEKGLFWDGRVNTLEEQALLPVEDPIELHNTWTTVEAKLKVHPSYPTMFREAFGINETGEITNALAVKAIAQFERILISSNSRFDKVHLREEGQFSNAEARGFDMYFDKGAQGGGIPDATCFHCHNEPLMTTDEYFNNGLDSVSSLLEFADAGLGLVTQDTFDNGKFRAPTLRNIALTAPYMHDGRFETLEEVLDFYNESPNHNNGANIDVNIVPLNLTDTQKEDIITFLHTFTDTVFINNPAIQSPF